MRTFLFSLPLWVGLSFAGYATHQLTPEQMDKSTSQEGNAGVLDALIESHQRYGSNPKGWTTFNFATTDVHEMVIIAPMFDVQYLEAAGAKVSRLEQSGFYRFPVFDIKTPSGHSATFISVGVGAGNTLDAVLGLYDTRCQSILFVGTAGALADEANLGDIVVPTEGASYCGADLYLQEGPLRDKKLGGTYTADTSCQQLLIKIAQQVAEKSPEQMQVFDLKGSSVDSVIAENLYLDEIKESGAGVIDMESPTCFHAAEVTKKKAAALLYISDCTFKKQALTNTDNETLGQKIEDVEKNTVTNIIMNFIDQIRSR